MVTPRILQQRRLHPGWPQTSGQRRRRASARPLLHQAGSAAARRVRLTAGFTRLCAALAVLLLAAAAYLVVAAQATQSSYDLARLKQQHEQLQAEQNQLRYQSATLHAPARVEQEAQQLGMQRRADQRVLAVEAGVDLQKPIGPDPADDLPRWQRLLGHLFGRDG
ncbi:MAG: cell division protein FtsL [Candidatus Dormibacteraeota bacterium]|uniref:Cell division protein FtsL n=1 Tax=Candidatus Dormiibacter inghamiae TaxID=3127013 RepID=A0A934KJR1_9BACT|nr:cell division protein FtsL [Candidatus Dormibacteraeota bacterium]MBJ7605804.1 cell division protein FtsL [Candidatus Dormibacteraeota bacterium]